MAEWQRELDLTDIWEKYNNEEMTVQQMSETIAVRLAQLRKFPKSYDFVNVDLIDLIEEFNSLSSDESLDVEEFDYQMQKLWDWGDMVLNPEDGFFKHKTVCWIKTRYH